MKDGYCGVPTLLNQAKGKNWRRRKRETPLDLRGLRPFNDHPVTDLPPQVVQRGVRRV